MGFDRCALIKTGFYHVRINCSLYQIVYGTNFLCFFFKYTNELFTDDLTLSLRIGHACQFIIKTLLYIHTDEIQIIRSVRSKYGFYLVTFVFTKKTMINEYTGELLSNSLRQKHCCHRRIYPTRQGTKHFTVSDLFTKLLNACLHKGVHSPVTLAATDLAYKVEQHLLSVLGVYDFRMELGCIKLAGLILHCCYRTYGSMCRHTETCRCFCDIVSMAHPTTCTCRNLCKKLAVSSINGNFSMTIFGNRRGCDLPSTHMCHKLGSITDAKDRNSHCKKFLVTKQCIFCINTVRTAGNNNSLGR